MTMSADQIDLSALDQSVRRYFTLDEANRSLVFVGRVVADVLFEYSRMLDLQETIEAAHAGRAHGRAEAARREILECVTRLHECLQELACVGAELRDWDLGIVDFACIANGREIRLCWQCGEPEISYWHEMDVRCAGRQGIETLPLEAEALNT